MDAKYFVTTAVLRLHYCHHLAHLPTQTQVFLVRQYIISYNMQSITNKLFTQFRVKVPPTYLMLNDWSNIYLPCRFVKAKILGSVQILCDPFLAHLDLPPSPL